MPDAESYLAQALRFWEVAQAAHDPEHTSQAASVAVLAIIAANDAVVVALGGMVRKSRAHEEAGRALREACSGTRWEADASQKARQLAVVLSHKNAAQYEGRSLRPADVHRIMVQTERFIEWAARVVRDQSS